MSSMTPMPLTAPAAPLTPAVNVAAVLAGGVPVLVAYNLAPSSTLFNQCLALSLWGWWVALLAPQLELLALRRAGTLLAALALMALAIAGSGTLGTLPASLTLSALGLVLASMALVAAGAALAAREDGARLFAWVLLGLAMAGMLSALVGVVQVFLPALADGDLIARSGLPGRAVGNLRQPNHLSSLLVWAAVATVALLALGRLTRLTAVALYLLLIGGVVLSGSRTGALSTLMLAGWALADRRLGKLLDLPRALLLATPLLYGAFWLADSGWAQMAHQAGAVEMGSGTRGDVSSSRFGIWSNTLALIAQQPWLGVGFGEFNLAWSLTPFPGRPIALFDHTHNLVMQLAVELGVPLATVVLALLGWALWQGARRAWRAEGEAGITARAAWMGVALMAVHSQLEYPLWYAYFLLPCALLWGYALGQPDTPHAASAPPRQGSLAAVALGLAMAFGGALAVVDYLRVVVIFAPPPDAGPLAERIAAGQRSVLFAHHADYAAVTTGEPDDAAAQALGWRRAVHHLLDPRLMMTWVRALDAAGDRDQARYVAARLREFRKPEAQEFFEPCDKQPPAREVQCEAPQSPHPWRTFTAGR